MRRRRGGGVRYVMATDLVGQETVGDVPLRVRGRGHERGVRDAHAVVDLVAVLHFERKRARREQTGARTSTGKGTRRGTRRSTRKAQREGHRSGEDGATTAIPLPPHPTPFPLPPNAPTPTPTPKPPSCRPFHVRPRRMEMASSTDGSVTRTGWNRRARAGSFSMYCTAGKPHGRHAHASAVTVATLFCTVSANRLCGTR